MQSALIEKNITYTGAELRSGWLREMTGIEGDLAAAWLGPCDVPTEHLVDLEDARAGAIIRARLMLHIIVEVREKDLERAVLRQRLLAATLAGILCKTYAIQVRRDGDDLFINERKLTVSIATTSPHSTLIHLGVNVDPEGAPVPAIGLKELDIDPLPLVRTLLKDFVAEHSGIRHAVTKVRPVR